MILFKTEFFTFYKKGNGIQVIDIFIKKIEFLFEFTMLEPSYCIKILLNLKDLRTSLIFGCIILEKYIFYRQERSMIFVHIQNLLLDPLYPKQIINGEKPKKHVLFEFMDHYSSQLLDLLYEFGFNFDNLFFKIAVCSNQIEILKWSKTKDIYLILPQLFQLACEKGFVNIVKWLFKNVEYDWLLTKDTPKDFLESKIYLGCLDYSIHVAVKNKHVSLIEYIYENIAYKSELIEKILLKHNEEIEPSPIKNYKNNFILNQDKEYYKDRMLHAIKYKNLNELELLYKEYPKIHPHELIKYVLKYDYDNMDIIDFLFNKYPIDCSSIMKEIDVINTMRVRYSIHIPKPTSITQLMENVYILSVKNKNYKVIDWVSKSITLGPVMEHTIRDQFEKSIYGGNLCRIKKLYKKSIKYLDTISLCPSYFSNTPSNIILWILCTFGTERILNESRENNHSFTKEEIIHIFISNHNIKLLEILLEKIEWKDLILSILATESTGIEIFYNISKFGIEINEFIWLYDKTNIGEDISIMDTLVCQSNIKVLKWLYENATIFCTTIVFYTCPSLKILNWIKEHVTNIIQVEDNFIYNALENISLDRLIWIQDNGIYMPENVKLSTVPNDLRTVKYMYRHYDVILSSYSLYQVTFNGNLELLKYLIEKKKIGFKWKELVTLAQREKHYHIIKYLEMSNI